MVFDVFEEIEMFMNTSIMSLVATLSLGLMVSCESRSAKPIEVKKSPSSQPVPSVPPGTTDTTTQPPVSGPNPDPGLGQPGVTPSPGPVVTAPPATTTPPVVQTTPPVVQTTPPVGQTTPPATTPFNQPPAGTTGLNVQVVLAGGQTVNLQWNGMVDLGNAQWEIAPVLTY